MSYLAEMKKQNKKKHQQQYRGPSIVESGSFRPWVVSAGSFRPGLFRPYFGGESIRPILVGRFGRKSFRPWVVSACFNIGAKSTYFCGQFVLNKYSRTY